MWGTRHISSITDSWLWVAVNSDVVAGFDQFYYQWWSVQSLDWPECSALLCSLNQLNRSLELLFTYFYMWIFWHSHIEIKGHVYYLISLFVIFLVPQCSGEGFASFDSCRIATLAPWLHAISDKSYSLSHARLPSPQVTGGIIHQLYLWLHQGLRKGSAGSYRVGGWAWKT